MKKLLAAILVMTSLGTCYIVYRTMFEPPIHQDVVIHLEEEKGVTPIPPEVQKEIKIDDALATINQNDLKSHLNYLCSKDLEGRMSGKKGNRLAAQYVKKQYESYGLESTNDRFSIPRKNPGPHREQGDNFTENVYAWIEGNDPQLKDQIVVVGAHFDHIGYGPTYARGLNRLKMHPGADDNGSGTAALLEVASALSSFKGKLKRTVVFQSYSGEEMGLLGSQHYCEHPKFPKGSPSLKSHVAMVNLDMVGYLNQGDHKVDQISRDRKNWEMVDLLEKKYSFAKAITVHGPGSSDHDSFYRKGVPVAFLFTGMHKNYHTPDDTPERINYNGLEQIARYALELTWRLANDENKPNIDQKAMTVSPPVCDHDHPEVQFDQKGKTNDK